MKNENAKPQTEKPKMSKNNRILLIFVCIFLSLVLVFGAAVGIWISVEDSNSVMRLGSITMDEGVVRVFASYYKNLHLSALRRSGYPDAEDTESFWNSVRSEDGKTQGEIYLSSLENYIAGIAAGCNLMSCVSALSSSDRELINEKTSAFISYYGSESEFDRIAEAYGFDYDDFCRAMELSYTSGLAFSAMYGYEGSNLRSTDSDVLAQCEEYLSTYSRVKLLFLCDEKITEEDENGDYVERYLTDGEIAEREEMAESLRAAIKNKEENTDGAITETMFDIYLEKSDGDPEMHALGYYFSESGEQTAKFAEYYPEVVERSLEMSVGEYAEVDCSIGKCFIYKCEPTSRAYQNEDNLFLSDFYADAAAYLYRNAIAVLATEASFKDGYYEIDLISIPENNKLFVTGWS